MEEESPAQSPQPSSTSPESYHSQDMEEESSIKGKEIASSSLVWYSTSPPSGAEEGDSDETVSETRPDLSST